MDEAFNELAADAVSVFAVTQSPHPEKRRVVRINGSQEAGFTTEVVSDYATLNSLIDTVRELAADGDEDDDHLMQAWQQMAMALAASDEDDDKSGILQVMNLIKNLLVADGTGQSLPTSSAFACEECARHFVTDDSARAHAYVVHESARDFNAAQRKKAAAGGAALPDGSFPIYNGGDLNNAARLVGKAHDPAAAKSHIRKRAKALGLPVPDSCM